MPGMTGLSRVMRLGWVVLLVIRVVIRLLVCGCVVSGSV